MDDTPRLEKQIASLKSQVGGYSRGSKASVVDLSSLLSSKNFYIGIWVLTFVFLVLGRPNFLYIEDATGTGKRKFSFSKLLMAWILIAFLLTVGVFGLNYAGKKV
jgi:hypothetical protein